MILKNIIEQSHSYSEYRNLVDGLVAEGKTTGSTQSEILVEFTKLNVQRMNRLDKTIQLSEQAIGKLQNNSNAYVWLLIGDAWCGDCAQIIPVISKVVAASNNKISFSFISRDTFPELITEHQTNGANAIPKLLIMDPKTFEVICTWGPRPKPAQDIMLNWKANKDSVSWEDFEKELHLWYARDKGESIINELIELIEKCEVNITQI
jgi:thiol-disulfide isomerase/thioredoxin